MEASPAAKTSTIDSIAAIARATEPPRLFLWRDSQGHEIDLLVELDDGLLPIEIKSGQTVAEDAFADLHFWRGLAGATAKGAVLVHGGTRAYRRSGVNVVPWFAI